MADNLSTVKVSGTSTEKTNLESVLKADDAGFQITVVGSGTYTWNGSSFDQSSTAGAAHVAPPDMLSGSVVWNEIANLTTTRQKLDFPSGATAIQFLYSQNSTSGTTAAAGRATYIVFNATSDADADGKLALAGSRYRLPLGAFPYGSIAAAASPITRVDVISEAAETGHSTLMVEARIPS